jgi:predicted unusual protein kinase regulating ubiquinone biosynthesis (AarF/ABC1/UbiB family)
VRFFNEYKESSMRELDYLRERLNMESIAVVVGPRYASAIEIPQSLPHLCTDRVITMTYIEGLNLEDEVCNNPCHTVTTVGKIRTRTSVVHAPVW